MLLKEEQGLSPQIETDRLVLRPLRQDDLDLYRRLRVRAESAQREVKAAVEHWAAQGFGPWVILERGSVTWTGASKLLRDDLELRRQKLWM